MADLEPKLNGPAYEVGERLMDRIDPDDPEYQKQMWRPPDIDQDMKEMDRRKRVEMIMNSQLFREELERIIEMQINEGYTPASLSALQQVTELLLPHTARNSSLFRSGRCVIPISDIRGIDGLRYAKGEKLLRCKLAAVYRLVDMYGWSQDIYNHITVRVSQDQEHFLLNPFGLQYHEVTASSLLKVDMQGNIVDPGTTNFSFNRAGFILHSTIHAARPDLKCIVHLQSPPSVAVSAMKCGLIPISQDSVLLGEVSYHEYGGILMDGVERDQLTRSMGPMNKVLVLSNHGILVCGESVEETFYLLQRLVAACDTQISLANIGMDNLHLMSEDAKQRVRELARAGPGALGKLEGPPGDEDKEKAEPKEKPRKWRVWDLSFESQMRMLDNAGFRSGYMYRQPLVRSEGPRQRNDVEVPPAATSSGQYFEDDKWLSPLKKLMEGKRTQDKMRWVNSPNVYQKVEVLETGTSDPKKITKWVELAGNGETDSSWVQEGSPTHSTTVKIDHAHQFVPKTGDPTEFKRKQKELKVNRMNAKVTAGPQSNILEGTTWEEIRTVQEQKQGDQVILVGAASKGIIQREFQHNAMVYKSAYAKNPFDNISDIEIEEYKRIVEKKQRGESIDDEDIPEEVKHLLMEPISELEQRHTTVSSTEIKSPPQSPMSPLSDDDADSAPQILQVMSKQFEKPSSPQPVVIEEVVSPGEPVQRSASARLAAEAAEEERQKFSQRRALSERKPKQRGITAINGEGKLKTAESGDMSQASRSSKEGSPVKELSESDSPKKDKKKKKGLRTPSFLKKKKKKEKEEREKGAAEA